MPQVNFCLSERIKRRRRNAEEFRRPLAENVYQNIVLHNIMEITVWSEYEFFGKKMQLIGSFCRFDDYMKIFSHRIPHVMHW